MGCGKSSVRVTEPKNVPDTINKPAPPKPPEDRPAFMHPHTNPQASANKHPETQTQAKLPPLPPQVKQMPHTQPAVEKIKAPSAPPPYAPPYQVSKPPQSSAIQYAPSNRAEQQRTEPEPQLPPDVAKASLVPQRKISAAANLKISASNFVRVQMGGISSDYVIQEVLGQGGFAVVNKCIHLPTGQVRAVKIVHKSGLSYDQTDTKYRLREIKVLRSLDHPNIMRCYELFEDRARFYIVMEYCQGGELFDAIARRRTLTEAAAAKVMFQLLSCMAYCHEKKVIHRDLKPENILLEDSEGDWSVKIADFGSSAFIDPYGKLTGCFGSAYYVAPEVVDGESYNEKCDCWSAGIILFIMLTGKPPYSGSNERQILENVRRKPFDPSDYQFQGISQEAIDLIIRLLDVNMRTRISAKDAVNHPWIEHYRSNASSIELVYTMQNLKGFNATYKLKDAVYTFLATNVISQSEMKSLRETFQAVDINSDGRLSREELLNLFSKYNPETQAHEEVEKILLDVDSDKSGFIDYSEFIKACMNYERAINKSNLKLAFQAFDVDGSGSISANELKEVLSGGEALQEDVWRAVIREVDLNGDGSIDLREFTQLMMSKI